MWIPQFQFILICFLVAISAPARSSNEPAPEAERPPNLIVILTDDQAYADWQGKDPRLHTPNLMRLAREGVELSNFHVMPSCSPTRAALLTGRHGQRTGVTKVLNVAPNDRAGLRNTERTVARVLAQAGYKTGLFGKWHLGVSANAVHGHGFQEFYGFLKGSTKYRDPRDLIHQGKHLGPVKGYSTDLFTERALEFMERNRDRPFFVLLSLNAPHTPNEGLPEDLKHYSDKAFTPKERHYYATVSSVDRAVGRVLESLSNWELQRHSVVVFLSDNGSARRPKSKDTLFHQGTHVPFLAWGPGRFAQGASDQLVGITDLFPTLLELAQIPIPSDRPLDGVSLLPLLAHRDSSGLKEILFRQRKRSYAAFDSRYRLILTEGNRSVPLSTQLYDLKHDPEQQTNLMKNPSPSHRRVHRRLRDAMLVWQRDVRGKSNWSPRK